MVTEAMRYKDTYFNRLGRSGLKVANIGLGTWKFGYPERGDGARTGAWDAHRILDRALELGVTFWDTADRYNEMSGNAERVIGEWLAANPDQRGNVVVATKVYGLMDGVTPNHQGLSRHHLMEGIKHSLARLQTGYVDLYQWHGMDPGTPLLESLRAMDDLVRRDLVRYIGVSNHTTDRLKELLALADRALLERIVSVQNRYNLLDGEREGRDGVVEFCAEHGLGFIPYTPLAKGMLTDRYRDAAAVGPGDRLYDEGAWEKLRTPRALRVVEALAAAGDARGKSVSQVALAWLLHHPSIATVIPTVRTVEQLEANHGATGIRLTDDEFARLNEAAREREGDG